MQLTRRALVAAAAAGAALVPPFPEASSVARAQSSVPQLPRFGYADVVSRAGNLATAPFDPSPPLPRELAQLPSDVYQDIGFAAGKAFFLDEPSPFRMELFHLGGPWKQSATINIIKDGIATPIPYEASLFNYGRAHFDKPLPINLGFAGLRLRFPLNDSRVFDEAIAFLGASYFRFLGRGQRYGLSARGLAVNTGETDEEFPFYREFWVETPEENANRATIYALLDGPSLTGAYQFALYPRQDSLLDVTLTLFARTAGRKIGFAPLTSMFCAGENDRRISDDYRPERHDSDGLSMHTGAGEWIWRPLRNPVAPEISSFLDDDVAGFGLLQRDRDFDHYQDIDRLFELHPSYWIVPQGKWGDGRVELVELPTDNDDNDNIGASWVSNEGLAPGQPRELHYTITATLDSPDPSPNGRVVATFETQPQGPEAAPAPGARRFLVDFTGGQLNYYQSDPKLVTAVPTAVNGTIVGCFLEANRRTGGFRATVDIAVEKGQSCDLRLFLRAGGRALTETWTFPWKAT
jgi:periplasmic glucans biosynthesis protein